MRKTTLGLAIFGLGLMTAPAMAQGVYPSTPVAPPVVGSDRYVERAPAPVAVPMTSPTPMTSAAPMTSQQVTPRQPMTQQGLAAQGVRGDSPLNGGDRVSAQADGVAGHTVDGLLSQAEQAVRRGNLPMANELVERAESLVLTRSTIAGTETVPMSTGPVARMAEARAAIARRDNSTAAMLIAEAASLSRAQGL